MAEGRGGEGRLAEEVRSFTPAEGFTTAGGAKLLAEEVAEL